MNDLLLHQIPTINSYLSEDQSFYDYRYIVCKLPHENIEKIYCLTKNILKKRFAEAEERMRWFSEFFNVIHLNSCKFKHLEVNVTQSKFQ